jgi:hypothetical protein
MSTNQPTFRFPFALSGQPKEVQQAHIFAFQGIQDCQQAIAAIKSQIGITKASSAAGTTNTNTVSEAVNQTIVTSGGVGAVNNQTGVTAYTTLQSDNGSFIIFNDASPITVTLSITAGAPSVLPPWYCTFINVGAGTATLTPVTGTINESMIPPGNALTVAFDGTNFWAEPGVPVPVNTPAVSHEWLASYNAATGAFTQTRPSYSDLTGEPSVHSESLTDGNSNFIFAAGDVITVTGVLG